MVDEESRRIDRNNSKIYVRHKSLVISIDLRKLHPISTFGEVDTDDNDALHLFDCLFIDSEAVLKSTMLHERGSDCRIYQLCRQTS